MTEMVTVRGKKYPKPHIDKLNRKQVKKLKPLLSRLQGEDLDALWGVIGLLIPELSTSDLDNLTLGECKQVLTEAGVANFDDAEAGDSEITMGE